MAARRDVGKFVAAFCLCLGAIIAAVVIGDARDGAGATPTTSARPATTDAALVASTKVAQSGGSTASPGISDPGTTEPAPAPTPPLPRPDFDGYCASQFGDGYTATQLPTNEVVCSPGVSASTKELDEGLACQASFGTQTRAIRPSIDAQWRCTMPTDRAVHLGSPRFDTGCRSFFGPGAVPTLYAHDAWGWRCAVIEHSVFVLREIDMDRLCATQFGVESFPDLAGPNMTKPDDWRCYGAP